MWGGGDEGGLGGVWCVCVWEGGGGGGGVWVRCVCGRGGGGGGGGGGVLACACVCGCSCDYFTLIFCKHTLVGSTLHFFESKKLSLYSNL